MLSGIQAKLVYQEFKLLLQNVWINHHKFIPTNAVYGTVLEALTDNFTSVDNQHVAKVMTVSIIDIF